MVNTDTKLLNSKILNTNTEFYYFLFSIIYTMVYTNDS